MVVAKVVNDIRIDGSENEKRHFIERLKSVYTLSTVIHLPSSSNSLEYQSHKMTIRV